MRKKIIISFAILHIILLGGLQAQNLLPHWDANGLGLNQAGIANTEMWRWGWNSSNTGYGWGTANAAAGSTRYYDSPSYHKTATKNGTTYTGRFAQLRWDNGGSLSYTTLGYGDGTATVRGVPQGVTLSGGKAYNFSFWGFGNQATSPTLTMYVTTDPTGADLNKSIASLTISDLSNSTTMKFFNLDFTCTQTNAYYLVFKHTSGTASILYMADISLHQVTIPSIAGATGITQNEFTANWSAIDGASSYQLDVATDNTFTNFIDGYNNRSINGISETITGLTPGTTYFYRIRSVIESTASGNSSTASTTTVATTIPDAPTAGNATDLTPLSFTANWNTVAGAVSYRIDVATDNAFTQIVAPYNNYTLAGTSLNISGLKPNTPYYYRVRAFNGNVSSNSNTVSRKTQKLYIILLAGQSNMAGRGVYSQLPPADTVTYTNILSLNKDSVWVRAKHPLHWDKAEAAVGMGISFARTLLEKLGNDVAIGLVPCAAGGTSIDEWLSNAKFDYTGNFNLYTNLITRANKAAESGDIIGMIWHQGEADASSEAHIYYQAKTKTLFTKVRNSLNKPYMPIVAGELGRYLSYPYVTEMNAHINDLAEVLPNYGAASSIGLTPNSDNIHFTATSQVELGKRYANVFYPIFKNATGKLDALNVGPGTLSPAFNPDVTDYTCYFPTGTNSITPQATTISADAEISGLETVNVSLGHGVSIITVSGDGIEPKTYTINYKAVNNVDYTSLLINNDFDLAPDPLDCSKSILVATDIDGWSNAAWRPKSSTCGRFYGWTCDLSLLGSSLSQGINTDGNPHGNWDCWIGGNRASSTYTEFELYQTIDKGTLPAGTYKVQCLLAAGSGDKKNNQRLFANNNVQYYGNSWDYLSNLVEGEKYSFAGHTAFSDNTMEEMTVYITINDNDSLKIGIRTSNKIGNGTIKSQMSPMFRTDYFRITKVDPDHAVNAGLANITLSCGNLNFLPETTIYHVTLPKGTQTVVPTATGNMKDVTIAGAETVNVSSGSGISTIVVTALDGSTKKTYTINYTVASETSVDKIVSEKASYTVTNRRLTVKGTDAYTVYNLSGIKIADIKANASNASVDLYPGIYIIRTKNAETFKVISK